MYFLLDKFRVSYPGYVVLIIYDQSNARRRIAMLAKWMEKERYCTSESNLPATAAGSKPAEL